MPVFFLSDIHLGDSDSAHTLRFQKFLREVPGASDTLLLGGDIFDLFVGNKAVFRDRFAGVFSALRALGEKGAEIYYLEGNHDFHVGGAFRGFPNFTVNKDSFPLTVGEAKLWIAHGDQIDPDDHGYRFLRWITRTWPLTLLIALLPGAWIDGIGRRSSHESRKYNNSETAGIARQERLRGLYLAYAKAKVEEGYGHVLVGHSHLRDQISVAGGEYLNLGISADSLVYGVLNPGKSAFEIRHYP